MRDPTCHSLSGLRSTFNFNPQVPCGTRRLFENGNRCYAGFQSTGPLRDPTPEVSSGFLEYVDFNPQVPCGTRLTVVTDGSDRPDVFQSTGPLRDPTTVQLCAGISGIDFNPQVPCGTRPFSRVPDTGIEPISIHRSLAGPDRSQHIRRLLRRISIHRSLAGPDIRRTASGSRGSDFNPQVPCGTRQRRACPSCC